AAAQGPFGGLIASGWQTGALMMRLFADNYLTSVASLASPGLDELRWVRPLRPGDRLWLICETISVRHSTSKPDRGVLTTRATLVNQDDEPVLTATALNMVARRPWTSHLGVLPGRPIESRSQVEHGDEPRGAPGIDRVIGPHPHRGPPRRRPLGPGELPHIDEHPRALYGRRHRARPRRAEIVHPGGHGVAAPVGTHDHQPVAPGRAEQWGAALDTAAAAGNVQHEGRQARDPQQRDPAAGDPVEPAVEPHHQMRVLPRGVLPADPYRHGGEDVGHAQTLGRRRRPRVRRGRIG